MGMFDALSISSTGMSAERLRMDENQILYIPVDVIKNRIEPEANDQPASLAFTERCRIPPGTPA